jgi:hypothetical protein
MKNTYPVRNKNIVINKKKNKNLGFLSLFMSLYFTTRGQLLQLFLVLGLAFLAFFLLGSFTKEENTNFISPKESYWLLLHRKSNVEYLYSGVPGDRGKSRLLKIFPVKTGVPGERPTPLPRLLGREYWLITGKVETKDDPETAPYFLILDVPYSDEYPFGPSPYLECGGEQCDWILPGSFGLHGINGDPARLSSGNPGSSGCVRHRDEDITYLYNLLDPDEEEIRYYIEDI